MAAETELERLVVRLVGDATSYQRMLRDAEQSTKRTTNKIDRLGKRIQSIGNTIKSVGRSLTFRLTLPIVALGAAAIKVGADFDSGFAGVRKTVDATEAELADLRKEFKLLLGEIPTDATELLGIGEIAGQLGIATGNITSFTKTIAMMAVTTNLAADEAASSMAKFANVAGMSQDKFSNLGSAIVALGNETATTERDIVSLAMRLVAAGSTIGLSEPQILGVAAALSSMGINAEAGGTAFSKLMLDISTAVATGGKDLKAFAKVAGTSAEDFRASFRKDAMEAITSLLRGLDELAPEARVLALKEIGVEGTRMTQAVLGASRAIDLLEDALKTSETAFAENTALAKEAEVRFKTFWSQVKLLKNQIKLLLGEAFERLEPMMRKMVARAKDLTAWFRNLSPAMKNTVMAALAVAAAIGPGLMGLGLLLTSSGAIINGIRAIGLAFTAMGIKASLAWAAATLGASLVVTGLLAIGFGLIQLQTKFGAFDPLVKVLREVAKEAEPLVSLFKSRLSDAVVGFGIVLKMLVVPAVQALAAGLKAAAVAARELRGLIPFSTFFVGGGGPVPDTQFNRRIKEMMDEIIAKRRAAVETAAGETGATGRNTADVIANIMAGRAAAASAAAKAAAEGETLFGFIERHARIFKAKRAVDAFRRSIDLQRDAMREGLAITEKYLTPLERFAKEQKVLKDHFDAGRIGLDTFNRGIKDITKNLEEVQKKSKISIDFSVTGIQAVAHGSAEALARMRSIQFATAGRGMAPQPQPQPRPAVQLGVAGGAMKDALGSAIVRVLEEIRDDAREKAEKTVAPWLDVLEKAGLR